MTSVSRLVSIATLLLCTAGVTSCQNSPYPAFGNETDALSSESPARLRLAPVWQHEVNPDGIAGFKPVEPFGVEATKNGMVVVATFKGKVHGYEARTGHAEWSVDLEESPGSAPSSYDDMVYISVSDGRLIALDSKNGEERWSTKFDNIIHGKPTIHDGVLYVMTAEEALVALDAHTGEVFWTHRHPRLAELEILGGGQPRVIDRNIYVGFADGSLQRISRQGDQVWSADLSNGRRRMIDVDSAPIEYRDTVIAVSHSGGVHALDKETGAIEWTLDQQGVNSPILVDDTLILTTTNGRIFWVRADSGRILKELKLARPGLTSPVRFSEETFAVADADRGVLLIGIEDNRLEALFETTVGISGQMSQWEDMLFFVTNRGMAYGLKATYD